MKSTKNLVYSFKSSSFRVCSTLNSSLSCSFPLQLTPHSTSHSLNTHSFHLFNPSHMTSLNPYSVWFLTHIVHTPHHSASLTLKCITTCKIHSDYPDSDYLTSNSVCAFIYIHYDRCYNTYKRSEPKLQAALFWLFYLDLTLSNQSSLFLLWILNMIT